MPEAQELKSLIKITIRMYKEREEAEKKYRQQIKKSDKYIRKVMKQMIELL